MKTPELWRALLRRFSRNSTQQPNSAAVVVAGFARSRALPEKRVHHCETQLAKRRLSSGEPRYGVPFLEYSAISGQYIFLTGEKLLW